VRLGCVRGGKEKKNGVFYGMLKGNKVGNGEACSIQRYTAGICPVLCTHNTDTNFILFCVGVACVFLRT
jgi:hypothetical protein